MNNDLRKDSFSQAIERQISLASNQVNFYCFLGFLILFNSLAILLFTSYHMILLNDLDAWNLWILFSTLNTSFLAYFWTQQKNHQAHEERLHSQSILADYNQAVESAKSNTQEKLPSDSIEPI